MLNIPTSFAMCSFMYIVLLCFAYFSKKRIKSDENKIYSLLIIANIFGIILDVFSSFISKSYLINTFDYVLLTKIIMVFNLVVFIFAICFNNISW